MAFSQSAVLIEVIYFPLMFTNIIAKCIVILTLCTTRKLSLTTILHYKLNSIYYSWSIMHDINFT